MITDIIAATVALAAVASIIVALRTYRDQVRSRQTQWLLDLRQRLLENERFHVLRMEIIRQMISSHPEEDTTLAKAIKKKRSHDSADTLTLTDEEIECLGRAGEYLDFFEILEQLIRDKRLKERDVFTAFNSDVDLISRSDLLALELTDYPLTGKLIERHGRIFADLYPHLVNTPRATLI